MDPTSIHGKVAFVTGAGSGLGEATARAFTTAGCRVIWVDWNAGAVTRMSDELQAAGSPDTAVRCDVSDADEVERTVAEAIARHGQIDFVVNCAAVDHTYWVEQLSVEQWDQVLDVNLRGPFLICKAVWPHMKRQGGGHIFNIASTSALRAASGAAAYSASKFGLLGFSRALNLEGRQENIRVTTIIPGGMRTHFFDRFAAQGMTAPDPGLLQDPALVASTILFAATMPSGSDVQELVVTSPQETGWP
jgi:NAD(P)-dependent dehydrogenase (short-subunit alcohol dehydrogenase family)